MMHRDMREPIHAARRWTVDRGKSELGRLLLSVSLADPRLSPVGGFSINPVNPNIAVTGHLKHDLR